MNNLDINNFKKIFNMRGSFVADDHALFSDEYGLMVKNYVDKVKNNQEIKTLKNNIKDYEDVTSFDVEKYYSHVVDIINANDYEFREYVHGFDSARYNSEKNIYENYASLYGKTFNKLNRINHSKIVLFRSKRVSELNKKLKMYESAKENYTNMLKKQNAKEHYLNEKQNEYKDNCDNYSNMLSSLAKETITEYLTKYPEILFVDQNDMSKTDVTAPKVFVDEFMSIKKSVHNELLSNLLNNASKNDAVKE